MKNNDRVSNNCKHPHRKVILWSAFICLLLATTACGSQEATSAGPTPTHALAATPISTHVFGQPTTIIKQSNSQETKDNGTPAAEAEQDMSRGERTYISKQCGDCHGLQGEGVAGKAEKLAGTQLTLEEFTDVLRTGGQGGLGNEHLYGTQSISPSGMEALYAYVVSLN